MSSWGWSGDIAPTLEALLPRIKAKHDDGFLKNCLSARARDRERVHIHASEWARFPMDPWPTPCRRPIGAAFATAGRQVVACCSDGGLSMLLGDLMTIAQYELPVKLMVFNNGSLGMVELEMQLAGVPDHQIDLPNPRFAQMAEACGIRGWRVEDPDNLDGVIRDALAYDGPVLVDVTTDRNAVGMPPHTTLKQLRAYTISQAKMLLKGRTCEVLQHVKEDLRYLGDL